MAARSEVEAKSEQEKNHETSDQSTRRPDHPAASSAQYDGSLSDIRTRRFAEAEPVAGRLSLCERHSKGESHERKDQSEGWQARRQPQHHGPVSGRARGGVNPSLRAVLLTFGFGPA